MKWMAAFLPGLAGLFFLGCGNSPGPAAAGAAANAAVPDSPTQAQPKLPVMKLYLGARQLEAELALNDKQWQSGMMFRTNIDEAAAMLFVFPQPVQASFWMKNTLVPLSAAYIDPDGTILEIHDLKPLDTNSVVASSVNIQYVLETKQGWFSRNNVSTGMVVQTERGPLHSTFFRQ